MFFLSKKYDLSWFHLTTLYRQSQGLSIDTTPPPLPLDSTFISLNYSNILLADFYCSFELRICNPGEIVTHTFPWQRIIEYL
jgi:hypothetical protein